MGLTKVDVTEAAATDLTSNTVLITDPQILCSFELAQARPEKSIVYPKASRIAVVVGEVCVVQVRSLQHKGTVDAGLPLVQHSITP